MDFVDGDPGPDVHVVLRLMREARSREGHLARDYFSRYV